MLVYTKSKYFPKKMHDEKIFNKVTTYHPFFPQITCNYKKTYLRDKWSKFKHVTQRQKVGGPIVVQSLKEFLEKNIR